MSALSAKLMGPPRFDDPDMDQRAAIINHVILIIIAGSMAGGLLAATQQETLPAIGLAVATVLTAIVYVIFRAGRLRLPSIFLPTMALVIITAIAYTGGGIRDTTITAILIPVIIAGLLLGRRGVVAFTGLVLLAEAITWRYGGLESAAYPPGTSSIGSLFNIWAGTVVVSVITYVLILTLEASRQRARDNEQQVRLVNATLEQRVQQRTEELAVALEKAEEASQMKSQFLASMSHELRTPLNAIINFTKVMRKGILGPVNERQETTLGEVVASGEHLLALINDVLDVSKIQSGMLTLFIEEDISINTIIDNVTATIESLIKDKPVRLVREIDPDLPLMTADQRRVQQVLLNLLSNAAKFTDEGTITLSASHTSDHVRFVISDTGKGIPAHQQESIFEPFIQTETGIRHAGGTGLGLPISKSLVAAHGGEMTLESVEGKGARFTFTLPIVAKIDTGEPEVVEEGALV